MLCHVNFCSTFRKTTKKFNFKNVRPVQTSVSKQGYVLMCCLTATVSTTLDPHSDNSVRIAALSVYCASVKTNCIEDIESLLSPSSRPWLVDICAALSKKECILFDVHCSNFVPINIEALQTVTAMYTIHGQRLKSLR